MICSLPPQPPPKRWYICGMREVRKAVRAGKARAVVVAPNIEKVCSPAAAAAGPLSCCVHSAWLGQLRLFRKHVTQCAKVCN